MSGGPCAPARRAAYRDGGAATMSAVRWWAAMFLLLVTALAGCGGDDEEDPTTAQAAPAAAPVNKFDGAAALKWVERQVAYGPRPAGSEASRRLAKRLRNALPQGTYQSVPKGLRNVIGTVPGKDPKRLVVVGAHYDTKDIPDFVGAVDGGSGTAVVTQLARTIKPRTIRPTLKFVLFDGEESPSDKPESQFERYGLRGSKVAARTYSRAEAMILLDFVGERDLRIPREGNSDERLWRKLRSAAKAVGAGRHFPADNFGPVSDDHIPFIERGVPAIDLIDFDFACFHQTCDDMSQIAEESLDATGETVLRLLATL
jgi:glutaminyl-peptide cyclotransferase